MDLREQVLKFYNIEEERDSKDLHARVYRLTHIRSGARVAVISNDDANKVFYIGFRTPPADSTGVPHILEHCVLCGSKHFPVKDPFMEVVKGSLNTFLNAFTYPDRTLYPVASLNDQDFQNLMHIYLDAVFYPNIYQEENIFKQEGWHYELENLEAPLTVNGVVYNEMKGAFSNPDEVMDREIVNALFPDTCYGVESGGKPECIPELSYQQFLEFHKTLYHPSNSYIYLYGNMDIWEKLLFMHEEYLKDFSTLDEGVEVLDTSVPLQKPFEKARDIVLPYPVMEDEEDTEKTHFSYNVVMGTSLDAKLCTALEILDYALCSAPGAPVKQALMDAGIGKDIYSTYEDGIYQPYFSIVAKDARLDQKEEFLSVIETELQRIVRDGFDKKSLKAALHYFEFRYREGDYGRNPKGLIWGLTAMDSWNYDAEQPFLHLESDQIYESLKEDVENGYFEHLVETYLLNNQHKAILTMYPEKGLTAKREEAFHVKMAEKKAAMTEQELQAIIDGKVLLDKYQDQEDSQEALESIPLLKREDLSEQIQEYVNEYKEVQGVPYLTHPIYTNGIAYVRMIFDIKNVPQELFSYIPLLKACMGYMDTTKHSYGDLFNEINLVTGGIYPVTNIYTHADDYTQGTITFELKGKVMYEDMGKALPLMEEILLDTEYANPKRLKEIISETKSRLQGQIANGHIIAAMRAMSYFSRLAAINERMNGISYYRFLEDLEKNFEAKYTEVVESLQTLCKIIFRKENLLLDIVAEQSGIEAWEQIVPDLFAKLYTCDVRTGSFEPVLEYKNEGFKTSGQIQYVCRAGNFLKDGLEYNGAFQVLKSIMGYEYLYTNVRVKGGAYGCMCAFGKTGDSYFVSYRDPNLEKTIDVYEHAAEAVENFDADERTMTQYIIGAISEMDTPMTPATLGIYSLGGYMTGRSMDDIKKERMQVLSCTPEDIRALAPHIRKIMDEGALCVVGNGEKITSAKHLFKNTIQLF